MPQPVTGVTGPKLAAWPAICGQAGTGQPRRPPASATGSRYLRPACGAAALSSSEFPRLKDVDRLGQLPGAPGGSRPNKNSELATEL
jgi:hypothetical protein